MRVQICALLVFFLCLTNSAPVTENSLFTVDSNSTNSTNITESPLVAVTNSLNFTHTDQRSGDLNETLKGVSTTVDITNITTIAPQTVTNFSTEEINSTTQSPVNIETSRIRRRYKNIIRPTSYMVHRNHTKYVRASSEKRDSSLLHSDSTFSGHMSAPTTHYRHNSGHRFHDSKHKGVRGRVILANTREEGKTTWGLTQKEAELACQRLANKLEKQTGVFEGHLLSVDSGNEISKLAALLNPVPVGSYWTGGSIVRYPPTKFISVNSEISLTWSDGEIGSASVLGISEEDINKLELNIKYCLAIDFNNKSWQARDCTDELPYACLIVPRRLHFSKFVYPNETQPATYGDRIPEMNTTESSTEHTTEFSTSAQTNEFTTISENSTETVEKLTTVPITSTETVEKRTTEPSTSTELNTTEMRLPENATETSKKTTEKPEIKNFFNLFG